MIRGGRDRHEGKRLLILPDQFARSLKRAARNADGSPTVRHHILDPVGDLAVFDHWSVIHKIEHPLAFELEPPT